MSRWGFYIICILFVGSGQIRASEDPWYFSVNRIDDCWRITKGEGIVVTLVDSTVNFTSILKGKKYRTEEFEQNSQQNKNRKSSQKYIDHGTAMASLISGDKEEFLIDGKYVTVAGVAPSSKISPVDMGENPYLTAVNAGVKTAYSVRLTLSKKEAEVHDRFKNDLRLSLISISSGDWYDQNRARDWESISDIINNDERTLVIAGVGNDWKEACDKNRKCFLPAMLGIDAVISVGATQEYSSKKDPELYRNSNYGEDVNILAPGANIAFLNAVGEATVSAGTSEATAIVAGSAALLASCNPFSTSFGVRQAILNNADQYYHLKNKSKDGRVLNIWKAVQGFCIHDDGDDPYDNKGAKRTDL